MRKLPGNWPVIRAGILRRDNRTCQVCGQRGQAVDVDHIVPRIEGGSDQPSNLRTICASLNRGGVACNRGRGGSKVRGNPPPADTGALIGVAEMVA